MIRIWVNIPDNGELAAKTFMDMTDGNEVYGFIYRDIDNVMITGGKMDYKPNEWIY